MSVIGPVQSSTCQKSFNFVNAFACYKQKCKLVQFNNLAHLVGLNKRWILMVMLGQ